jgi:rhodanese-related sulfurtransferase
MVNTIRAEQLKQQLSGALSPQVIDIRDGDAYAVAHIPGALNIPIKRMQYSPGFVPDEKPVVLYTSQGVINAGLISADPHNEEPPDENMVQETADELKKHGIQVTVLEGGLNAWIEAGFPIEIEGGK